MSTNRAFHYQNNGLYCEGISLHDVAAQFGTPAYVYSQNAILSRFRAYDQAFGDLPHRVCFAVKANSNLGILHLLAREGAGFDIVSGGELFRVLAAGGDPEKVVFSGVGKTEQEIRYALEHGIHSFNCESEAELRVLSAVAKSLGKQASIALRVNPDVDASTHPYISTGLREHKFGVDISEVERVYEQAMKLSNLIPDGVSCHIGSQLLDLSPLLEATQKMVALVERLRAKGIPIKHLDLGGGLGVPYRRSEGAISIPEFVEKVGAKVEGMGLDILVEPGRSIVAEAGALLTRVIYKKQNGAKTFVIVDAGMNDLIRPALYQAYHEIIPVQTKQSGKQIIADIVGPVCETGDFFARDREIAEVGENDLMAIQTAGAYSFVLSSNYNSRPRACELLVNGSDVQVVRQREAFEDLIRGETSFVSVQ